MKKVIINIILVLVALASLVFACKVNSVLAVVAIVPLYLSFLGLVRLNTDWIENY